MNGGWWIANSSWFIPNFAIEFVVVVLMLEDWRFLKKLKAYHKSVKSKLFLKPIVLRMSANAMKSIAKFGFMVGMEIALLLYS